MRQDATLSELRPRLPPGQRAARLARFGLPTFARRQVAGPARPVLTVGGQVRHATQVDLLDLIARLPRREQRDDLHCVTTWSALDLCWSGVPLAAVLEELATLVQPDPRAGWLSVTGLDGFVACLSLADATVSGALLADRLDGEPLPPAHGAPVRLVAPAQYAYKSVKHVVALDYRRRYAAGSAGLMEHSRARVDREERSRVLPGRLWRPVWATAGPHVRRRYEGSDQAPA